MISIRSLNANDAADYRRIRLESLKKYPGNFGTRYEDAKANPKLLFERYLEENNSRCFVMGAFDGAELIGILGFVDSNEDDLAQTGTFIQMYVKGEYQDQGIGGSLTVAALHKASTVGGIQTVLLEVKFDNLSAIASYRKSGFQDFVSANARENGLIKMKRSI